MNRQPHIIIADDDDVVRALLVRLLAQMFPVALISPAANGADALALYHQRGADLILSDYHMPLMDGPALTAALRAEGVTIPMVLMSAGSDHAVESLAAGATAFFPKYGAFPELIATVEALLSVRV